MTPAGCPPQERPLARRYFGAGTAIIAMGPQLIVRGMPADIIRISASPRSRKLSMLVPSMGVRRQVIPSLVISIDIRIMGIDAAPAAAPCMGIGIGMSMLGIMPGTPIIPGIPIMPGTPIPIIGIMPGTMGKLVIGMAPIGPVMVGCIGIGCTVGIIITHLQGVHAE